MTEALLSWYQSAKRDLPWRQTTDPYAIWVSEVMLQQTQVKTVLPYYERWMQRFPDIESLALADTDDVLAAWQGLGYYRRCRLLLEGVRRVVSLNIWPKTWADWRSVPGVGDYTAAALASFCSGEVSPVVDGNVERVFARVTASALTGSRRRKAAREWARSQISSKHPADWNQAIMELGATICKPMSPTCGHCPVSQSCIAHGQGRVEEFPVRNPKPPLLHVRWHVVVPVLDGRVGVRKASPEEWWTGMWRFPFAAEISGVDLFDIGSVKHTVTRHRLSLQVSLVRDAQAKSLHWASPAEMEVLPIPSAMRKVWSLASLHVHSSPS